MELAVVVVSADETTGDKVELLLLKSDVVATVRVESVAPIEDVVAAGVGVESTMDDEKLDNGGKELLVTTVGESILSLVDCGAEKELIKSDIVWGGNVAGDEAKFPSVEKIGTFGWTTGFGIGCWKLGGMNGVLGGVWLIGWTLEGDAVGCDIIGREVRDRDGLCLLPTSADELSLELSLEYRKSSK